jgi:hypothetical protein
MPRLSQSSIPVETEVEKDSFDNRLRTVAYRTATDDISHKGDHLIVAPGYKLGGPWMVYIDNGVMGGLVNAIFWLLGQELADQLLTNHTPMVVKDFWMVFVKHVNTTLPEYMLKRFQTDDGSCPMVVQ